MPPSDRPGQHPPKVPAAPRDLPDFHLRWREFRSFAKAVAGRNDLSHVERDTLQWLIEMADRVGPADIGGESQRS